MLFRFWLEKFKDFWSDFVIEGKCIEIRPGYTSLLGFRCRSFSNRTRIANAKTQWHGLNGERESITFLEGGDVLRVFIARIADLKQICLEERNSVRQELSKRAVQVFAKGRVQRILKHMRKLAGYLRETRESIARRGAAERVRGNVQPLQIFAARLDLLQHAHVLTQILQVLGGLLEEQFNSFALGDGHAAPPSNTCSDFCNSSAVGLR